MGHVGVCVTGIFFAINGWAEAVVTNISARQTAGTRTVEVAYDVAITNQVLVRLHVIEAGSNLNAAAVSGAVGLVDPGTNRVATWNAGADWNGSVDELSFQLITEDGLPLYLPYDLTAPSLVPRTGQTNSYTSLSGEDGDLQPGLPLPSPRFTNNGNATYTDNLTGLMWCAPPISATSWLSALSAVSYYSTAGFSDWRVPNIHELQGVFNYFGTTGSKCDQAFPCGAAAYWSSTVYCRSPGYMYTISTTQGITPIQPSTASIPVLAVRGTATGTVHVAKTGLATSYYGGTSEEDGDQQFGEAWPSPRFTDNGDMTVTDNLTGLMWMTHSVGTIPYTTALNTSAVTAGGHTDWRLPSINELISLIDYGNATAGQPMLPSGHPFVSLPNYYYWSSTTYPNSSGSAYGVDFSTGAILLLSKSGGSLPTMLCRLGREIREAEVPDPQRQAALPKSGQTISYQSGDDGDLQIGVSRTPRFTVDPYSSSVFKDNLTGLGWYYGFGQFVINRPPYESDWGYALTLSENFNVYDTVTYSSWRLPNIRELQSLLDFGQDSPALPAGHPFSNVQSNAFYWSSTLCAADTDKVWVVSLSTGDRIFLPRQLDGATNYFCMVTGVSQLSDPAPVWQTGVKQAVHSGDDGYYQTYDPTDIQSSTNRFANNGNGTVSDADTGLMWLQDTSAVPRMNWSNAVAFCENMTFAGHTDWRLPNVKEMECILDYQNIDFSTSTVFNVALDYGGTYWTSTTAAGNASLAVYVNLLYGSQSRQSKSQFIHVWPVRAGD